MTAHEIHALSGAYVVDALDDLERARFEEHLAQCAECQTEVASFRETSSMLGELDPVTPPPALRDRLMAEIRTVRPLPPVVPTEPETSRRPARWRGLAVAAALLAAVAGGAVVVDQIRDEPAPTAIERVLGATDAEGVSVEMPGQTRLRLVRSASEGRAVLITRDLPPAPQGKVYELWLQNGAGDMVPAGLLDDHGNVRFLLEGDAATATAAGITVEPDGGSDEPTSAPMALFDLSRAT